MLRVLSLGLFSLIAQVALAQAAHPDDVEFQVRLTSQKSAFHIGESIPVERVYSSRNLKTYELHTTSTLAGVELRISPAEGVVDRKLLQGEFSGIGGSILSGESFLRAEPIVLPMDLRDLYRFAKPGHYSLVVVSTEVSRHKSAEEGGGRETVSLESSTLEFDILPPDAAWEKVELERIEQTLEGPGSDQEKSDALVELGRLDTPAAIEKLLSLYRESSGTSSEFVILGGLRESTHLELAIRELRQAVADPAVIVPNSLPDLLATLETRQELGIPVPCPTDPEDRPACEEKSKQRYGAHVKYLKRANELLSASLKQRSGPQRAAAVFQMWLNAEGLNRFNPVPEGELQQLREEVLGVAEELSRGNQWQVAASLWSTMPHDELLPLVRSLAEGSKEQGHLLDADMFRMWCEERPRECTASILAYAIEPSEQGEAPTILLMTEAEHPELDATLEARLRARGMNPFTAHAENLAALILRAGSRNLIAPVEVYLDGPGRNNKYNCATHGYLLGYLFRMAVKDAGARLLAELQVKDGDCGYGILHTLSAARYSEKMAPIVTRGLDSPNLETAFAAALFLGAHGTAPAEQALWQRLEALHEAWRGRASELQAAQGRGEQGVLVQVARLEGAIASALVRGTNWQLSAEERERLRSECITEECKIIADGKMFLNF